MSLLPLSQNSTISSWHKNNERHIMTTKIKKTKQSIRKDYENKEVETKKDESKEVEFHCECCHHNLRKFDPRKDNDKDV